MSVVISWSLPDGLLDLIGYTGAHSRVGFYSQGDTVMISDGTSTWSGNEFVHGVFFQHPAVVRASESVSKDGWWWVADTVDRTLGLYPKHEALDVLRCVDRTNVVNLNRFRVLRRNPGLFCPVLPPSRQQRPRDLFDEIISTLNLHLA